ncbi:DUF2058 domain-containing protein [Spongorhabdus nitratireducens]
MSKSLRDQLMGAGLANKQQAQDAQKHVKKKKKKGGGNLSPEARAAQAKARQEQAQRDRELNLKREAERKQKGIQAEIRQLIEQHRMPVGKGEVGYNFVHDKKIKKLYVTADEQTKLARGKLAVMFFEETYYLLQLDIAERIIEREPDIFVLINKPEESTGEDDDYPPIPDDLMW